MPVGQPAFQVLNDVVLVSEPKLRWIYEQCTTASPISLHSVLDPDLHLLANETRRIEMISTYHMGIPLYHLSGSKFPWPEQALVDAHLVLDRSPSDPQSLASETYVASEHEGQLAIFDKCGQCYCRLRKRHVEAAVEAANHIASIRNRHGLEDLYNFDGNYLEADRQG